MRFSQKNNVAEPTTLINSNQNNFDVLRFILAVLVIFSHSYVICYGKLFDIEPGMIFTHNQTDLGGIAVDFFFIISGFLILQSFLRSETNGQYFKKRFLRIYPGYFVAFVISILIIGTLGTAYDHSMASVHYYFQTIPKKRLLLNLLTLQKPMGGITFTWLPLPGMLNESLWTIEYEFFCYLLFPIFLFKKAMRSKAIITLLFLLTYCLVATQHFYPALITENKFPTLLLYVIDPVILPRLMIYFFAGACFYLYRDKIRRSNLLALLAVISIWLACRQIQALDLVLPISGSYLLFYVAYHPQIKLSSFAKNGDLSYGMYLYAWPLQQLLWYALYKHMSPLRLFILAVPLTYAAAWLSWHYIEKFFLSFKHKRAKEVMLDVQGINL